ncbi:fungal-specific transcription factor domain-containing protein [Xylaria cf. heliscus]|nr:fungal-specific transcription factor domain-containing protein [Xylaria cf. heliscus]
MDHQEERICRPGKSSRTTDKVLRDRRGGRRAGTLTCANCRTRKVRCEGSQPACKTCEIYNVECRYDKLPPVTQVIEMARRLQEAEKTIMKLQTTRANIWSPFESLTVEDDQQGQLPPPITDVQAEEHAGSNLIKDSVYVPYPLPASTAMNHPHSDSQAKSASGMNKDTPAKTTEAQMPGISVDDRGEICALGLTSAVYDPSSSTTNHLSTTSTFTTGSTPLAKVGMHSYLAYYCKESSMWEDFALGNASLQTGMPRQRMAKLLQVHWTWVSPMFAWVYKPAFIRDMATLGRYYSEFLLIVICAHAAKYQQGESTALLLARARSLLGTAIQQPSSIPTVQALLQMSAHDFAQGNLSQAWIYSGIAFRMANDLGLQHCGPDIKFLNCVDLEIRRRLFWSCYFWDKATSLYAGRLPTITEPLPEDTLDLLDDSTDQDVWVPYYHDSVDFTILGHGHYPPTQAHLVSSFINSCRLSVIINDIIIQLYSRRNKGATQNAFEDIKERLDLWRTHSPPHLKYDPDCLPSVCPPPHIISQNLLYFASVILAHRPFWSVAVHYEVCVSAARSIERLILLLESTFGLENITYLMGYCIYTGASAILEEAKSHEGNVFTTLQTFLRALNTGRKKCPMLKRSLDIIIKGVSRVPEQSNPSADQIQLDAMVASISTFPCYEPTFGLDFDINSYSGYNYPNSGLDCFPEIHMASESITEGGSHVQGSVGMGNGLSW